MAKKASTAFDPLLETRAKDIIAHGALTNSKRPSCFVYGVYPTHLERGRGCYVWDTNGNKYIDFICGLGTNLLGYANEEIAQAISDQARRGSVLSLSTRLEIECAERIKLYFPFIERLRFLKTGSDACSAAIRIARSATGRMLLHSEGYHGWHDEFTSLTPPAKGVPYSVTIQNDHSSTVESAAVILEPAMTQYSEERKNELKCIRKRCDETQTLLIYDEVITGLRFQKNSVAAYSGVIPDLICLGKALGGGLPLSVVAGKAPVMESDYFVSSTFAGETLALAACLKTLELLEKKFKIDHLWDRGAEFLRQFNSFWPDGVWIEGYPTRGVFKGDPDTIALFWQEACRAGILFGPSWFFCFPHLEVMDEVLSTCKNILGRVRRGEVSLDGERPKKSVAQQVREIRS